MRPARPLKGRWCRPSVGPCACPTRKKTASGPPSKQGPASSMMPSSTQRVQARQAAWSSLSWRLMLRLGLIGDTQGRYRVDRLLRFVAERFAGVDEIWHVGDWQGEGGLGGAGE